MKDRNPRDKLKVPPTPAVAPDKQKEAGGAPIADSESVKEAKDWVDYNHK